MTLSRDRMSDILPTYIMTPDSSKITVRKRQQNNLMVGVATTRETVSEDRSVREVGKHSSIVSLSMKCTPIYM